VNVLEIAKKLKFYTDQQLLDAVQKPSGTTPTYLVMGELNRRKEARPNNPPKTTVMQDLAAMLPQSIPMGQMPGTGMAHGGGVSGGHSSGVRRLRSSYEEGGVVQAHHEESITEFVDGQWVNLPTVMNGKRLTPDQAVQMYRMGKLSPLGGETYAEGDVAVNHAIERSASFEKGGRVTAPGGLEAIAREQSAADYRDHVEGEYWNEMVPEMDVLGAKVVKDYGRRPPVTADRNKFARQVFERSLKDGKSPYGTEREIRTDAMGVWGATDPHTARRVGPSVYLNLDQARPFDEGRETINHEFRHVGLSPVSRMFEQDRKVRAGALEHPIIAALALQNARTPAHRKVIEEELTRYKGNLNDLGKDELPEYTKRASRYIKALQTGDLRQPYENMPYSRVDTDIMERELKRYAKGGAINFDWNPKMKIPKKGSNKGIGSLFQKFADGGPVSDYDEYAYGDGTQFAGELGRWPIAPPPPGPLSSPGGQRDPRYSPYNDADVRRMLERNRKLNQGLQGPNLLSPRQPVMPPPLPEPTVLRRPGQPMPGAPATPTAEPTITSPKRPETDGPSWSGEETPGSPTPTGPRRPAPAGTGVPTKSSGPTGFEGYLDKYAAKEDPYSEMRKRLAEIETERKGRKGDALNTALIQWGLGMAAGKSPHFLSNVAEGGLGALKGYKEDTKALREDEMLHLSAQAKMAEAKVAYDRGEWSKAFELYKEAGVNKRHAETLAKRGAGRDSEGNLERQIKLKILEDSLQGQRTRRENAMRFRQELSVDQGKLGQFKMGLSQKYGVPPDKLTSAQIEQGIREATGTAEASPEAPSAPAKAATHRYVPGKGLVPVE
jgi:hypothetical protein